MTTKQHDNRFKRVAENLYRYAANNKYYAVFRHHGKLKWKSLRTTDRELAKRKLKDEIAKAGKTDPKFSAMSLSALLNVYEKSLERYEEKTKKTRIWILKTFRATWKNGLEAPVHEVTKAHLELWLAQHSSRLKKASLNEFLRFLRHLFQLAVDHRVIVDSPAADFKTLRPETPIRLTPTHDQFQAIIKDIRAQSFADAADSADLLEFMGLAGVGTAECANLKGEHVNLAANRITLYRSKTDTGYTIPVYPQVAPLMKRLSEKGRIENGQPVFKVRDCHKALAHACARLKMPNFSPRSLRRFFITCAVELGIDFKTISAWQGHRDGGVLIAKTYSHLRSEHSDAMAKKLVAV